MFFCLNFIIIVYIYKISVKKYGIYQKQLKKALRFDIINNIRYCISNIMNIVKGMTYMIKRLVSLLLASGIAMSASAFAADNSPSVYVNGEKMTFNADPYIENDRTLVPMRAIFEAVGAKVTWDGEKQTVFGVKENNGEVSLVSLQIGKTEAFDGSRLVTLDAAPVIKENTTFVPLRFVSETLGAKVEWNNEDYAVIITVD